ncbi:phage virion morphogenesis protein [Novosphingobium sp. KN65.2]|uniref:phage virion morphogenesis protein n=1 Tax=Novosphingobium sp. KN65.2 TaxID=1478134 RepID=UPI0005DFD278|nr:phage virion morphogenesis protein [Novosphingobium sp. KN65.2]CDO35832.1 Tail synthesis protein S [Novosphingobium sp. KN65.2]
MAETFAEMESYFAAYLNRLSLAQRRKVYRKIGMELRKANAKRIAANVQPDGSPMQARKARPRMKDAKGRIRRSGKMFRKLRQAKNLKVRTAAEGVSVGYEGSVAHTARIHQYGLRGFVGRTIDDRIVRAKYPARVLLGFGPDELEQITDLALGLLHK